MLGPIKASEGTQLGLRVERTWKQGEMESVRVRTDWCVRLFGFPPLTAELLAIGLHRRDIHVVSEAAAPKDPDVCLVFTSIERVDPESNLDALTGDSTIVTISEGSHNPRSHHPNVRAAITTEANLDEVAAVISAVAQGDVPPDIVGTPMSVLTARELEIMRLLATGKSNSEVAQHLGISTHTVRSHVQSALSKLDVKSRVAAIVHLKESGLIGGWLTDQP